MTSKLTHLDDQGRARMVDVSAKAETSRSAVAEGAVVMQAETLDAIVNGGIAKGDVLRIAELAGIMAAKKTGDLIPLCHPLPVEAVDVAAVPDDGLPGIRVKAAARLTGRTGVEMEALTAVSVACLTIYDMAKAIDRGMTVADIRLVAKSGGKSGDWRREP